MQERPLRSATSRAARRVRQQSHAMPGGRPKNGLLRLAQIKVQGYHKKYITDGCADIIRSATDMGLAASRAIPLPNKTKLLTIMKGPFVDRKALEQWHHTTHKRLITLYGKSTTGHE